MNAHCLSRKVFSPVQGLGFLLVGIAGIIHIVMFIIISNNKV